MNNDIKVIILLIILVALFVFFMDKADLYYKKFHKLKEKYDWLLEEYKLLKSKQVSRNHQIEVIKKAEEI